MDAHVHTCGPWNCSRPGPPAAAAQPIATAAPSSHGFRFMRHGQLAAFLCKPLQAHNGRHIHHLEFTKNLCYCCCLDVLSFATLCGLPIGLHVGYTPDLCKRRPPPRSISARQARLQVEARSVSVARRHAARRAKPPARCRLCSTSSDATHLLIMHINFV